MMNITKFFKRDKTLQNVDTIAKSGIQGFDRNYNKIPDYLERPDLPSIYKSNKDFSTNDVDVTPEIEEWIMELRGYQKSADGMSYESHSPPIINEIGISSIKSFVVPVINKHSINTALKIDEVNDIVGYSTLKFIRWLKYNYKRIDLPRSYLDSLAIQYEYFLFIILSRSVGDLQRKHISDRLKLSGNISPPQGTFPA